MTRPRDIWDTENFDYSWPTGWAVRHVEDTTSTNDDLLAAADEGQLADRSVLIADHQTAGRGRLDRRWDAPPGANLLASIYLAELPANPTEVMHRVGLAIVHTVDRVLAGAELDGTKPAIHTQGANDEQAPRCGLKWPNDVLLDGRKLAGVLAQRSTTASGAVVGFGVNVGWAPEGAARLGVDCTATCSALLAFVLEAFDQLPADVSMLYSDRLETLGQHVRVELLGGAAQHGRAIDVDDTGRLIVLDDEGVAHQFGVGDVVHLRPT